MRDAAEWGRSWRSAGTERSYVHKAWNRGKRSVMVDVSSSSDRELLRKLITGADVLVDEGPGGRSRLRG